jgi:hypothetical protein
MYQVCLSFSCARAPHFIHTVPGWTIFDRLYIFKGVVYIVSDDETSLPDKQFILSRGIRIKEGQEAELDRLPTDEDIRVISTEEAKQLFGSSASIIDGVTVCHLCFAVTSLVDHLVSFSSMTLTNCMLYPVPPA